MTHIPATDVTARGGRTLVGAASSLGHTPMGRWEFDDAVTAVFDDMLARSIPHIDAMRESVTDMAARFVQSGTYVVDLGCSLGAAMAPLVERYGGMNRFLGVEASAPMVAACRERFSTAIEAGIVEIRADNLRHGYPDIDASVTLCILTLMFTPIEHRFELLAEAFHHTRPGGCFILVEKILGMDAHINATFTALYHDHKRRMGYTTDEINRKRLSLQGALVPVTAAWNEQMLSRAGFAHVECFWRCLNFAGWVGLKA